jgi:hypothetical protein
VRTGAHCGLKTGGIAALLNRRQQVILLTPSLLLGPSFLVLTVSLHQLSSADRRIWSQVAIAFATAYAVLTGATYYVQLTLVAPRLSAGRTAGVSRFFLCLSIPSCIPLIFSDTAS